MLEGIIPGRPFNENAPQLQISLNTEGKKAVKRYLRKYPFVFAIYRNGELISQSHLLSHLDRLEGETIWVKVIRRARIGSEGKNECT